ncbi:MAG TPA: cyclopropane-fatty-acyl-phospholipid synthase family protein [Acidimicrobiales bacterium]|nr:cyclopropane-fatty-acyl-phospholipid synthase family protein [Acidimicrobiales bacterium]
MTHRNRSVAEEIRGFVAALIGDAPPVGLRFWDGSTLGPTDGDAVLVLRSPLALRYLLWSPGELGLARAFVSGELELEGDIYAALGLREQLGGSGGDVHVRVGGTERLRLAAATRRLGALGPPPPPPPEEVRLAGGRHSKARDAAAISHHYDISNDFYRLVLGETMTYSCALFRSERMSLDDAQRAKYDLICRKLGLAPGMRLLDVGCGWGGMVLHAAEHYGVRAVGVTISRQQARLAAERIAAAGLTDQVEIRVQDYRDVGDGPYDAISSIGMFEHVGLDRLGEYFGALRSLMREEGRVLNHAISRPPGQEGRAAFKRRSFIERYVFPDGELHEVGSVVSAMQACGLEARDVECLREHYATTLRRWVANLEANWDEALALVGPGRARVWQLYMAASALNFAANRTSIHQVLAVRARQDGASGMPPTREELLGLARSDRESFAD